jgi:hypothetical protein
MGLTKPRFIESFSIVNAKIVDGQFVDSSSFVISTLVCNAPMA